MKDSDNFLPLVCVFCDRDCTNYPHRLTHNDGTVDGPACQKCAHDLNIYGATT